MLVDKLNELLKPIVEQMGYEAWGIEYHTGNYPVLRIYIDHENGITVDDCAIVSEQIGALLDTEDLIQDEYTLEVSSPGADRLLFTVEQCERFRNKNVKVTLNTQLEGRRKFKGQLIEIENDMVTIKCDDETHQLDFNTVMKMRIVPEFN